MRVTTAGEHLLEEVGKAKKEYITDGYTMTIGELSSLFKDGELVIDADFQRKFYWSIEQQSRFIESILMGVPLPSIFVYSNENGQWEVVDGVQRLTTIFSFMSVLSNEKNKKQLIELTDTKLLPSLKGMKWQDLPQELQLDFRRSKIEVKIIKSTSGINAKYELFERLHYVSIL